MAAGSDIIFTDDVSLQVFFEHLQRLAVQSWQFYYRFSLWRNSLECEICIPLFILPLHSILSLSFHCFKHRRWNPMLFKNNESLSFFGGAGRYLVTWNNKEHEVQLSSRERRGCWNWEQEGSFFQYWGRWKTYFDNFYCFLYSSVFSQAKCVLYWDFKLYTEMGLMLLGWKVQELDVSFLFCSKKYTISIPSLPPSFCLCVL